MTDSKPSSWKAKRQGTLNKFYTRPEVSLLLIQELSHLQPAAFVDLGAGEGSLSAAVGSRWPKARAVTVDIDSKCLTDLYSKLTNAGVANHEHHQHDVLDANLPTILGEGSFDLAVCNPPFFRPAWKRAYADILQSADFAEACPNIADVTAEVLFFAQNIRLIRSGGTIALIVPDKLATGWPAVAFRQALLRQHTLRTVVQLPPYSFLDTEAYCFIMIVEKRFPSRSDEIRLVQLYENGTVSKPLYISQDMAEVRLDYSYHALASSHTSETRTLRQLGAEIQRGSLSSVQRKALKGFVFHTGDFPANSMHITFDAEPTEAGDKRLVVAETGDILMARVDRSLHEKIVLVCGGKATITDCVYRIRVPERHRASALKALSSIQGRALIRAATKGVGARLIGKGDLLDIPLPVHVSPSPNTA